MKKHEIEAAKVRGLLNTLSNELTGIELGCKGDNVEKTYGKVIALMPYVKEIITICDNIKKETSESKEGD